MRFCDHFRAPENSLHSSPQCFSGHLKHCIAFCQMAAISQVPPAETVPQVKKEKHSTQAKNRAKRKPPKGMFLSQEDVEAVSANATAATTVLRQLDMELVSIKRQVWMRECKNSCLFWWQCLSRLQNSQELVASWWWCTSLCGLIDKLLALCYKLMQPCAFIFYVLLLWAAYFVSKVKQGKENPQHWPEGSFVGSQSLLQFRVPCVITMNFLQVSLDSGVADFNLQFPLPFPMVLVEQPDIFFFFPIKASYKLYVPFVCLMGLPFKWLWINVTDKCLY